LALSDRWHDLFVGVEIDENCDERLTAAGECVN
jgi:hypothetical protein